MSELDEELAAATDKLLSGYEAAQFTDGNRELDPIVRQIYFTIAPNQPPTPEFERRLTERLNSEWDRAYGRERLLLLDSPWMRVVAAAAAVVLILAAVLALAVPIAAGQAVGTAHPLNVVVAAGALVLFAVLVVVIARNRR